MRDLDQIDDFGVPVNTFGLVPERFYGAIGRIAMLGALVESRFADVVGSVIGLAEADFAGWSMAKSGEKLRDEAAKRDGAGRPLTARLVTVSDEAVAAMWRRNDVIHTLWPSPGLQGASGWRNVPPKQRAANGTHCKWTDTDIVQLRELIAELLRVAGRLRDVVSETSSWPDPSETSARRAAD